MSDCRAWAEEQDAGDPLAALPRPVRHRRSGRSIYLDGNSLGRLPKATRARLRAAIDEEWGAELIRGWDHWIDLARAAGDVLAEGVLGAAAGEVILRRLDHA